MRATATVLLVDDHGIVRAGLRALLQQEETLTVVGEASSGREAIQMIKELTPDVVVMDVSMPDLNGIDATRQALAVRPELKVIGLSGWTDDKATAEMLRAGAVGHVAKVAAYEELVAAIQTVLKGGIYFSPTVLSRLSEGADGKPEVGPSVFTRLSQREREVLQLIAEGKATKEVAPLLHVSVKTVETHRRNLMEKLQLDSVAELTKYAIREGLTSV